MLTDGRQNYRHIKVVCKLIYILNNVEQLKSFKIHPKFGTKVQYPNSVLNLAKRRHYSLKEPNFILR